MTAFRAKDAGPWEVWIIPALKDNYIYGLIHADTGHAVLVDPGENTHVISWLQSCKIVSLHTILLTHHHGDHTAATAALKAAYGGHVVGAAADAHRLPPLDRPVSEGERFTLSGEDVQVLAIPGHTLGHVAYYLPSADLLFCGDTLFSLGCGRLFEGTPAQMLASLQRLAALPDETWVCCGHEYTLDNARFALTVEPGNPDLIQRQQEAAALRAQGLPTLPARLGMEKRANPFLRTGGDVARFAELRAQKDAFR
jgi:hydroxyacylglutathione hydrolase